jgi:hypothetical protein
MDCNDAMAIAVSIRELDEQLKWEFSINGGSSFDEAISNDAKMNRPLADLRQPIVVTVKKEKKKPVIVNSVPSVSTHLPPNFGFRLVASPLTTPLPCHPTTSNLPTKTTF